MAYMQRPPSAQPPYNGGGYSQPAAPYGQPAAAAPYQQQPYRAQVPYGGGGQAPPPQLPPGTNPQIASFFTSIDTDGNGALDAVELQKALAMGNLHFGLTDVDQMVRAFDTKGTRTLNIQEFCKLHEFLGSVTLSFNYFDQNKTQALQLNEVVKALQHAGFTMDPPVVQAMFKKHDPNNTNTLSLDEFIRLCLFLQSCVRTFGAFDAQRTGRISLDFNQFVYAASHIS